MPDRYLRGAILDSERFNTLTLDAQNFYYRLISVVDDFGTFDGRAAVIAAHAYKYGRTEALPLLDLQRNDLVVRYLNAGKPFIALLQWGEVKRGLRKFPAPPINNDRPEVRYIGIYGRQPNWRNPPRTDAVSILLGLDGRPVQPQPPEWRRVDSDWAPIDSGVSSPEAPSPDDSGPGTPGPMPHRKRLSAAAPGHPGPGTPGPGHPVKQSAVNNQQSAVGDVAAAAASPGPEKPGPEVPGPTATAATNGNGKIRLNDNGEWEGLSEAQRLRWQGMFANMSVPDQVERAGAWLLAHDEERRSYEQSGEQEQFLIRWLLREAKQLEHPR